MCFVVKIDITFYPADVTLLGSIAVMCQTAWHYGFDRIVLVFEVWESSFFTIRRLDGYDVEDDLIYYAKYYSA
jgi:hypothetical protein